MKNKTVIMTDIIIIAYQLFLSTCSVRRCFSCLCFFFFLWDFDPETQLPRVNL